MLESLPGYAGGILQGSEMTPGTIRGHEEVAGMTHFGEEGQEAVKRRVLQQERWFEEG